MRLPCGGPSVGTTWSRADRRRRDWDGTRDPRGMRRTRRDRDLRTPRSADPRGSRCTGRTRAHGNGAARADADRGSARNRRSRARRAAETASARVPRGRFAPGCPASGSTRGRTRSDGRSSLRGPDGDSSRTASPQTARARGLGRGTERTPRPCGRLRGSSPDDARGSRRARTRTSRCGSSCTSCRGSGDADPRDSSCTRRTRCRGTSAALRGRRGTRRVGARPAAGSARASGRSSRCAPNGTTARRDSSGSSCRTARRAGPRGRCCTPT